MVVLRAGGKGRHHGANGRTSPFLCRLPKLQTMHSPAARSPCLCPGKFTHVDPPSAPHQPGPGAGAGGEGTSHRPGEAGAIRLPRPGPGCAPRAGGSCPSGALLPQGGQGALGSHGPGAREPSLSEPRRPARASVEAAQTQTCDDSQPPTRPPGHGEARHVERLSLGRGGKGRPRPDCPDGPRHRAQDHVSLEQGKENHRHVNKTQNEKVIQGTFFPQITEPMSPSHYKTPKEDLETTISRNETVTASTHHPPVLSSVHASTCAT